jgi:hypothetical protein
MTQSVNLGPVVPTYIDPSTGAPSGVTAADDSTSAQLLPEPSKVAMTSGDPGAELAMMILQSARDDKKIGKATRQSEEAAQQVAEDAQLKALQEKSDETRTAAIISGVSTVAAGAFTVVGAGATADANTADPKNGEVVMAAFDGESKVIDGSGKLFATIPQGKADDANKEATHQEQLAGRHKRAADDAHDDVKDASDMINRAIGYYKDYLTAKSDEQRATLIPKS